MKVPPSTRKYTPEEKQQLIKNLDIEVEHRVRQLEEWLAVALENFRLHQEGLISRIPKLVRGVTMSEFADKYNGDVQACLRGLQSERVGGAEFEIDRDTRKRKWAAAQEEAGPSQEGDHQARATKNARMMTATPKKSVAGPSNAPRSFAVNRTPGALRTTTTTTKRPPIPKPSPSPYKPNKPPPSVPVRTTSPTKPTQTTHQRARPPSSATFNPMLPPKAPTYPTLRAPRRDESMLSVNGSPLANPYTLGLGWFTGEDIEEEESHLQAKAKGKGKGDKTLRRVNSIVIRHDPSGSLTSFSSPSSSQPQPQTNGTSSQTQRAAPHFAARSRSDSQTKWLSSSDAPPASSNHAPAVGPSNSASALVSIPTKDGRLIEFDPLATSPRALDELVGITESAKKQAKVEMARLVKEAVRKWVIE